MKHIIEKIRSIVTSISDDSIAELANCLTPVRFAKSQLLVCENSRSGCAYFIEEGITHSYWVVDGEEITTSFSTEGDIVFSMDEVYYGKPSEEYVKALSSLKAYRISISDLHRLTRENMDFAQWWITIHQNEYRRIHRSHRERLALSAQQRYVEFCRQFPEVCQRVNRGYIASYLGITLSTLSRISRI